MVSEQQSNIIEWVDPATLKPHKFSQDIYGANGHEDLIESIKELGVLQPIFVTNSNIIISGHRRWQASIEALLSAVPVIRKVYGSESDEQVSIIEHNRYRIKNGEQLYREGKALESIERVKADLRAKAGIQADPCENFHRGRTTDNVASSIGLGSGKQWDKLDFIAEHKPELLPEIKPQGISIHAAYTEIRKDEKLTKLEAARSELKDKAKEYSEDIPIYHGDFREICKQFEDNSIDHIFTDPPYKKEFLPLWSDLSSVAARVLKPGGYCICYSGTYHLQDYINRLSEHLEYYWQFILLHKGVWQRIQNRCLTTGYKPLLVFYKPPYTKPLKDTWDIIEGTGTEKGLHEWAQAEGEAREILNRLTSEGELILEPFAGSGTILKACQKTLRRAIGIDDDVENINIIKGRLAQ